MHGGRFLATRRIAVRRLLLDRDCHCHCERNSWMGLPELVSHQLAVQVWHSSKTCYLLVQTCWLLAVLQHPMRKCGHFRPGRARVRAHRYL